LDLTGWTSAEFHPETARNEHLAAARGHNRCNFVKPVMPIFCPDDVPSPAFWLQVAALSLRKAGELFCNTEQVMRNENASGDTDRTFLCLLTTSMTLWRLKYQPGCGCSKDRGHQNYAIVHRCEAIRHQSIGVPECPSRHRHFDQPPAHPRKKASVSSLVADIEKVPALC
jgi:hypothetical protein